jgi:hypothetical protein
VRQPVQRRQQRGIGHVTGVEHHRCIAGRGAHVGVAPRPAQRCRIALDRVDLRIRSGVRHRESQCTGSCTQINHQWLRDAFQGRQPPRQHGLGFGAGNEHSPAHGNLDWTQGRSSSEVLQRHPLCTLVHQRAQGVDDRRVDERNHRQPPPRHTDYMRSEQLSVYPRGCHPSVGEDSFRLQDR